MNDSRPRVIFVNRVYWPSTEATAQLLTDLAEGLAARGHPVHVIAAGHTPGPRNGVVIHRTGTGDRHGGLISRSLNYRRFQADAARELARLARPGDTVVAMTDPPLLGVRLAPLATRLGLRFIPWVQDIYPEIATVHLGQPAGLLLHPLQRQRNAAWRSAAACVTLGEDMGGTVRRGGGAGVTIIPNWAPRELHQPADDAAVAERRRTWGIEDRFTIAYSGNLGRVHEFATVLDAAEILRGTPSVEFLFIGRGPRFDAVARAVRTRDLGNVRLLPPEPRERLAAALAAPAAHLVTLLPAYGALVYPSKLAGVLAAARPVLCVGPTGGDISRLLRAAACGSAFAPGDAAGLAATITRWHADRALIVSLGRAARAAYERDFTFAAALDRWDALLHPEVPGGSTTDGHR